MKNIIQNQNENKNKNVGAGLVSAQGITLITLVITVVILIILAGVAINLTLGENGLFRKAQFARDKYNNAVTTEEQELNEIYAYLNGDDLPQNSPETQAGTPVAMPSGWYTQTPTYVQTPSGEPAIKSTKVATVVAVSTGSNETIPVPSGFYYVGGDLSSGVVISDNKEDQNKYAGKNEDGKVKDVGKDLAGNQFVWIPCNINNYVKTTFASSKYNTSWDKETNAFEQIQIEKYGGFYVARYEAGMGESGFSNIESAITATTKYSNTWTWQYDGFTKEKAGSSAKPTSKANEIPWYHANYPTAVEMSKRMYANSSSVKSGLITGTMWDVMVKYMATEAEYNSSSWGNYDNISLKNLTGKYTTVDSNGTTDGFKNVSELTNGTNSGTSSYVLLTTGSTEETKKKNIYDVAGNLWEWTVESADRDALTSNQANADYDQYVLRGGSFDNDCGVYSACYRGGHYAGDADTNSGFRPTLYVK